MHEQLPPTTQTLQGGAITLLDMGATGRWFPLPDSPGDTRLLLFCLPYAGAGAGVFRTWQHTFSPDIAVLPVRLPGREQRIAEPAAIDPAAVAAAIAGRADRDYALYGHSLGGRLAFEVIRELRHTGSPLPVRCFVGASRPPHVEDPVARRIAGLPDPEFLREVRDLGGTPDGVLEDPDLRALLLPALRADFGWLAGYRCRPEPPLPVPIVAFCGADDPLVSPALMAGWAAHTSAGFRLETLPGGHFFLHHAAERLIELPGDALPGEARP